MNPASTPFNPPDVQPSTDSADTPRMGTQRRYYRPDARAPERLIPAEVGAGGAEADLSAVTVHGALRAFILDPHYTCVGAKSAVNNGSYRLGVYGELDAPTSTAQMARDLATFVETSDDIDAAFATFVAAFESPRDTDEKVFERRLWGQLQRLHDRDDRGWDPAVSGDPESPHFSFSFAGTAFFVVGLHPGSGRLSRRFPWPAMVFNPHRQFERLREEGKWERMQAVIRDKERALQGNINPVLRDFGDDSEARQYSGRSVGPEWRAPFEGRNAPTKGSRCPFERLGKLMGHPKKSGGRS